MARRDDSHAPTALWNSICSCDFARDLHERLGILGLLALSAPFRICKLQIPLLAAETGPVSGNHSESITYEGNKYLD